MTDYLEIRELYHHGIKGQRWGIRRFQNEDGTLTAEGKQRYGIDDNGKMSKEGKKLYKSDVKQTRKSISGDWTDSYHKNFEKYGKELYGKKHWTNYTPEERKKVEYLAERDTTKALVDKYGNRSVKDFNSHNEKIKAGVTAAGAVLATIGTIAAVSYVLKDTGTDKALGKAGGKVLDNLGKAAFR